MLLANLLSSVFADGALIALVVVSSAIVLVGLVVVLVQRLNENKRSRAQQNKELDDMALITRKEDPRGPDEISGTQQGDQNDPLM